MQSLALQHLKLIEEVDMMMSPAKVVFYNRRMFFYVVMVLVMSGFDAVATVQHISRGVAAEGNPFMEVLLEQSAVLFFLVKMFMTALCMVIFYNYSHKKTARFAILMAVSVYSLLCVYHAAIAIFG